ncbi:Kelch repeat-containing protein [Streptomyces sp. NPDC017991]|uniref:Kelch repeat-containing protein n=1 Tax=Streptomyces sp. NPDC017991 TaxID=3365026 RepID=UPI00378CD368
MRKYVRATVVTAAIAGNVVLAGLGLTPTVAAAHAVNATAGTQAAWQDRAPSPDKRAEVGVAALGGDVYVVGGTLQHDAGPTAWATTSVTSYNPHRDRWSQHAPLPRALTHVGVAALGGKLYAFGGFTSPVHMNPQSVAYVYDPRLDRWDQLPDMPENLGSVTVAAVDGKLHLLGGRDSHQIVTPPGSPFSMGFGTVRTHLVYDPAHRGWSTAQPLPAAARDHAGVAVIGHRIHVFGGRVADVGDNLNRHDVYDTRTGRWTQAAPLPVPRSSGASVVLNGQIVYAGGECRPGSDTDAFNDVTVYNPRTNRWTTTAPLPQARHAFGAARVGNRAYFIGGAPTCGGGASSDTLQLTLRQTH